MPVTAGVFLKMDIEGGEYQLLPEVVALAEQNRDYFSGLCIEFHDISRRESEFHQLVQRLQTEFSIVHVHVNNCASVDGDFPTVLEISFAKIEVTENLKVRRLPKSNVDFPNNPSRPDFTLIFE
jgi:hypothetical protein